MKQFLPLPLLFLATTLLLTIASAAADRPNVVIMMTDDQGIGDFGVMGNTLIDTPNIDKLAAASASMSTFYVSPVCSPTRASLMTGRYNQRTRCIDTWIGRSMMDTEEDTIAEALKRAGYATGLFGKWHLGDCYPMRPQDQGFDEVLMHLGGGLAQPSEPLENARRYTDPILFRNGEAVQTKGFCTDVYFDAGMEFIEKQKAANKPFFVYLPTNAPHGPYHDVPEELRLKYMERDLLKLEVNPPKDEKRRAQKQDMLARVAAMIENEDQNVGRLMVKLTELGLLENTLVIRLNDNGPNSMRYVGEMRGMKTHAHEGGIRSPLWLHWPAKLKAGTVRSELAAHIDIMPTLLEACGASTEAKLDGKSFLPLLLDPEATAKPRRIVIQSHRGTEAVRYHHFMIRNKRWKLVHPSGFGNLNFKGEPKFELYDLKNDPKEQNNLVGKNDKVFNNLKNAYDKWFDDVSSTRPDNYAAPRIIIGTAHENPTALTRQDWQGDSWRPRSIGNWKLEVAKAGNANIEVIFEPGVMPAGAFELALKVQDHAASQQVPGGTDRVTLKDVPLAAGPATLDLVVRAGGKQQGVYQAIVTFK